MARNRSSFLPWLLGPIDLYLNGVKASVERREAVDLVAPRAVVTDDPENERTVIDLTGIDTAGSPAGNESEVQVKSGGAFAGATHVKAGSGYVSIGASPASEGAVRLASGGAIKVRTADDEHDISALTCNGFDELLLGDLSWASWTHLQASSTVNLRAPTVQVLSGNGVARLTIGGTGYDFLALGASPASEGAVRLTLGDAISARNAADDGDLRLLSTDAGNTTIVGNSSGATWLDGTSVVQESAAGKGIVERFVAEVMTSDAATTNVKTGTIPSGSAVLVEATIVAIQSDCTAGASYSRRLTFRNNAGTVATVGAAEALSTEESSVDWDATIDHSETTWRVRVSGEEDTDIRWTASVTVTTITY